MSRTQATASAGSTVRPSRKAASKAASPRILLAPASVRSLRTTSPAKPSAGDRTSSTCAAPRRAGRPRVRVVPGDGDGGELVDRQRAAHRVPQPPLGVQRLDRALPRLGDRALGQSDVGVHEVAVGAGPQFALPFPVGALRFDECERAAVVAHHGEQQRAGDRGGHQARFRLRHPFEGFHGLAGQRLGAPQVAADQVCQAQREGGVADGFRVASAAGLGHGAGGPAACGAGVALGDGDQGGGPQGLGPCRTGRRVRGEHPVEVVAALLGVSETEPGEPQCSSQFQAGRIVQGAVQRPA